MAIVRVDQPALTRKELDALAAPLLRKRARLAASGAPQEKLNEIDTQLAYMGWTPPEVRQPKAEEEPAPKADEAKPVPKPVAHPVGRPHRTAVAEAPHKAG